MELGAERTDFDAYPPIQKLRANWPIGAPNVDRAAVAASLVFAPWIAGSCEHPQPFSALTAQRLAEWFQQQNIWVSPGPVRKGGLPLPRGRDRLHLSGTSLVPGEISLRFVASDQGSGQAEGHVRIAGNTEMLMNQAPGRAEALLIRLGSAVLVAESLSVNEIVDPEFAADHPNEFHAAARLLECTALGLRNV